MMTPSDFLLNTRLPLTRMVPVVIVAAVWLLGVHLALGWLIFGTALAALGQGLRLWAAGHLVKRKLLATTGPFAHFRHPLYWGSALIGLGLCVASRIWWSYLLIGVVFIVSYIPTLVNEEKWLERNYGAAYRRYSEAVPRFGVRLRGYRAAEGVGGNTAGAERGFRWRCVLRNLEHHTVAATVLLFAALWIRAALTGGLH